jgi:hypothetical protein
MKRVRLYHWNESEARQRARELRALGYRVVLGPLARDELKKLRARPPHAAVIDLSRLPSHGRDVAMAIRESKSTRAIPLVFVGGARDKVARTRSQLPDAVYTSWGRIEGALKRAIAKPPAQPVVPSSRLAGYSGTPLPKKLGVKPGYVVALAGAPEGIEATLGELPEGVTLRPRARGRCDLLLWFARSRAELLRRIERLGNLPGDAIWIAWPKQASGVKTDLTQTDVRRAGLDAGLVDYKICSIDATWSGLKFTRRKT